MQLVDVTACRTDIFQVDETWNYIELADYLHVISEVIFQYPIMLGHYYFTIIEDILYQTG